MCASVDVASLQPFSMSDMTSEPDMRQPATEARSAEMSDAPTRPAWLGSLSRAIYPDKHCAGASNGGSRGPPCRTGKARRRRASLVHISRPLSSHLVTSWANSCREGGGRRPRPQRHGRGERVDGTWERGARAKSPSTAWARARAHASPVFKRGMCV